MIVANKTSGVGTHNHSLITEAVLTSVVGTHADPETYSMYYYIYAFICTVYNINVEYIYHSTGTILMITIIRYVTTTAMVAIVMVTMVQLTCP